MASRSLSNSRRSRARVEAANVVYLQANPKVLSSHHWLQGDQVVARLDRAGHVTSEMRQAGLLSLAVSLLGRVPLKIHTAGRCPAITSPTTVADWLVAA